MKKISVIILSAVMALTVCACGGGAKPAETTTAAVETTTAEETTTEIDTVEETTVTGVWEIKQSVDEFGDVVKDGKSIASSVFVGDFSNTATSNGELLGVVSMSLDGKTPRFLFSLLEYGDKKASYTSSDELSLKIKIDDQIIEFSNFYGAPPNSDLMLVDNQKTIYEALYNGTDVKCIIYIGSTKYNFTLNSREFNTIADELDAANVAAFDWDGARTQIFDKKNYDYINANIDYFTRINGDEMETLLCDGSWVTSSGQKVIFNADGTYTYSKDGTENTETWNIDGDYLHTWTRYSVYHLVDNAYYWKGTNNIILYKE